MRRGGRTASPSACRGTAVWRPALVRLALAAVLANGACTGQSVPLPTARAAAIRTNTSTPSDRGSTPAPTSTAPTIRRDLVAAPWARAIDQAVGGYAVSVAIGTGRRILYEHVGERARPMASNQKLLTSMTLLDTFGRSYRLRTRAMATGASSGGVLRGDLWIVGGGDPGIDASRLEELARRVRAAGIRRITGSIFGDTSAFDRGWWAPGWLPGISRVYVTRPTALAFDGNAATGTPEALAAAALGDALAADGVEVAGSTGAGRAPDELNPLASIRSAPLRALLEEQNHGSVNFIAEMLTKALGDAAVGTGSTAAGARVIDGWVDDHGVEATVRDGSGLSDQDRTSASGVVALLLDAEREPWFATFRASLPAPGEGTLAGRLAGLPVRAKTGTLFVRPTSCLSGYVRARDGTPLAFSVLTRGLDAATAQPIEDAIVRIAAGIRSVPTD
jgi:serine-type D-Ala-D-Ala carboxypeptidase/endopeptidase (penicillin-binding protein 4)